MKKKRMKEAGRTRAKSATRRKPAAGSAQVPDLEAIRARLLRAGHPRPTPDAPPQPRAFSPEAQRAREELREHIIADMWALIDALEARRGGDRG
ncbi:MAG: hypothetical protein FJ299_04335 [Planctomycetes bacterium]|nr:hypothetical protein [Planctomycetota bacterium]